MNIAVIGGGVGGLAAAISCARAGHTVTVIEKNADVGGKLWAHSAHGFVFDCGPSLLTLPSVLHNICGDEYRRLGVTRLEEICHYFWSDGTEITSHASAERFAANIARVTGDSERQYLKYAARTKRLFTRIAPLFLTRSIGGVAMLKSKLFWKSLPHLPLRMGALTLHAYNERYFKSAKTRQIFDRFATYIGSSPYRTAAVYSMISFIEHGIGAYYVPNGMRAIPKLMKLVAERQGVQFVLNQQVRAITPRSSSSHTHNVRTAEQTYACDALISNIDSRQTERLLHKRPLTRDSVEWRSTSAIVYLWGIDRVVDRFGLHNILFSDDYRAEFDDIFVRHRVPTDPTVYINISSKKASADAPQGMENWFVMINVPATDTIDWSAAARRLRAAVTQKISRLCGTDIAAHIVYEKMLTPSEFARSTCDEYGSLYGQNVHGVLGPLARQPNDAYRRAGIYQCGGTVHPGGGVPLAILSGCIAANRCSPQSISFPTLEY